MNGFQLAFVNLTENMNGLQIGLVNVIKVSANLDIARTTYTRWKTLVEKKPELVAVHKEAQNIDYKYQRTDNSPVQWHPGALFFAQRCAVNDHLLRFVIQRHGIIRQHRQSDVSIGTLAFRRVFGRMNRADVNRYRVNSSFAQLNGIQHAIQDRKRAAAANRTSVPAFGDGFDARAGLDAGHRLRAGDAIVAPLRARSARSQ